MEYVKRILKESSVVVVLTTTVALFSGTNLMLNSEYFITFPVLLLLLPAQNDCVGDLATVFVTRLSTQMFIGTVEPKYKFNDRVKKDLVGVGLSSFFSAISLIIFSNVYYAVTGEPTSPSYVLVYVFVFVSVIMMFFILSIALFFAAVFLYRRKIDPANVLIAMSTTLADFLTPVLILSMMRLAI